MEAGPPDSVRETEPIDVDVSDTRLLTASFNDMLRARRPPVTSAATSFGGHGSRLTIRRVERSLDVPLPASRPPRG